MLCSAAALVSGDDYVAYNQHFAIINITYHSAAMDMAYSEVSFNLSGCFWGDDVQA